MAVEEIRASCPKKEKQHWRTYMMLNLVLVALEKLVEEDFVCPCRLGFMWAFFFLYLLMPLFVAINFSIYLWNCNPWDDPETKCKCRHKRSVKELTCLVPSVFWLILFFGDGRYVACLITPLEEDRVDSSDEPAWEWCDKKRVLTEEQSRARESFYISKIVVFSFILLLLVIALFCQCVAYSKTCCKGCCEECEACKQSPAVQSTAENGNGQDNASSSSAKNGNGQDNASSSSAKNGNGQDNASSSSAKNGNDHENASLFTADQDQHDYGTCGKTNQRKDSTSPALSSTA
ncbi:hypothetical protein NFI96_006186 [Prochilodus magdalenae]|nr:hypothetical protein NFI96_006186 [Prochilodus magdalenae]